MFCWRSQDGGDIYSGDQIFLSETESFFFAASDPRLVTEGSLKPVLKGNSVIRKEFWKLLRRGHQGEYLDANPLERAPDGEVKANPVGLYHLTHQAVALEHGFSISI